MGDWPNDFMPSLPTVTPFSPESLGGAVNISSASALASGTLGSQIAVYFPWTVEVPTLIVKGFVLNGASVAGNTDVGVYDHEFNLIVSSGATLQAGTNAIQEFNITDTTIMPGRYWIAVVNSSTGTVFLRAVGDEIVLGAMPLLNQGSLSALPSTATPAKSTSTTPPLPVFGFSTDTVI